MSEEISRALPSRMYGDPAKVFEEAEQVQLGCRLCSKSAFTWHRVLCVEPRNGKQLGVPGAGHRCKWFDERRPGELLEVRP